MNAPSVLALALVFCGAAGGAGRAAEHDDVLCQNVLAQVRRASADPSVLQAAVKDPKGFLTPVVAVPKDYQASPDLLARAAKLYDEGEASFTTFLQPIQPGVWRAAKYEGTLDCAEEWFFKADKTGALVTIPPPAGGDELCWTSYRDMGTVDGRTALIEIDEQTGPYLGFDLTITPWQDGWGEDCSIEVRYNDRFQVSERFCGDAAVCVAASSLAPALVQAYARNPGTGTLAGLIPGQPQTPSKAQLTDAKASFTNAPAPHTLPTFGATPKTQYPEFSAEADPLPVTVGGQTLIARVGVGGLGWRTIGDGLVAFYRQSASGPVPVASFVVRQAVTGLRSAKLADADPAPRGADRRKPPVNRAGL